MHAVLHTASQLVINPNTWHKTSKLSNERSEPQTHNSYFYSLITLMPVQNIKKRQIKSLRSQNLINATLITHFAPNHNNLRIVILLFPIVLIIRCIRIFSFNINWLLLEFYGVFKCVPGNLKIPRIETLTI